MVCLKAYSLFPVALAMIKTMIAITAITMKIPKSIPALKILAMTPQELIINDKSNNMDNMSDCKFFIAKYLKVKV